MIHLGNGGSGCSNTWWYSTLSYTKLLDLYMCCHLIKLGAATLNGMLHSETLSEFQLFISPTQLVASAQNIFFSHYQMLNLKQITGSQHYSQWKGVLSLGFALNRKYPFSANLSPFISFCLIRIILLANPLSLGEPP